MGQTRLEVGQQKLQQNLIESFGTYTDKISEHFDDKTEVLNKRVYKVETEIERLSKASIYQSNGKSVALTPIKSISDKTPV